MKLLGCSTAKRIWLSSFSLLLSCFLLEPQLIFADILKSYGKILYTSQNSLFDILNESNATLSEMMKDTHFLGNGLS